MQTKTIQDHISELHTGGTKTALIDFGDTNAFRVDYASLAQRVTQLAEVLYSKGYGPGKRILVMSKPKICSVTLVLAVLRCGAELVPVDTQIDKDDLEHILNDCRPALMCLSGEVIDKYKTVRKRSTSIQEITDNEESLYGFGKGEKKKKSLPAVKMEDTAILFYTSGTTGPPKGVPLSHANIVFQFGAIRERKLIGDKDNVLLPLPLHHVYPLVIGVLVPLVMRSTIVLPRSITGPDIVRAVHDAKATAIIGVPRLYAALHDALMQRIRSGPWPLSVVKRSLPRLSSLARRTLGLSIGKVLLRPVHKQFGSQLRLLASGGSALEPSLYHSLEALGWSVAIGYGLTETSPLITINGPGEGKAASAGRPLSGLDVRIEGAKEAQSGVGEVCVRGPNVFGGYLNMPQKTDESFTKDGYFKTGDLGSISSEGYLFLHGRASLMIVTESGENIQPEDVERVYARNKFIKEAAILQKNRKLVGIFVPDIKEVEGKRFSIEEAIRIGVEEQSAKLAGFKRVNDYVISRAQLPRTRLGKLRRHLLEPLFDDIQRGEGKARGKKPISIDQMSQSDRELVSDPNAKAVWRWMSRRYGDRDLSPDSSPQLDLGIDSLGWMEITMSIRQVAGVDLDEQTVGSIKSVRDLLQAVAGRSGMPVQQKDVDIFKNPESFIRPEHREWLEKYGSLRRICASLLHTLVWAVARIYWRVYATGADKIPWDRQLILLPNHVSYIDPFMLASVLPATLLRNTWWAGYAGIAYANALTRFVSRTAKAIPIEQGQSALGELAFAASILNRGKNLVWFPQGRRAASGSIHKIQPGIGILLEHYKDLTVVPVCIRGTFQSLPVGRFFPHPTKVLIHFGKPLTVEHLIQSGQGKEMRDRIVAGVKSILEKSCQ